MLDFTDGVLILITEEILYNNERYSSGSGILLRTKVNDYYYHRFSSVEVNVILTVATFLTLVQDCVRSRLKQNLRVYYLNLVKLVGKDIHVVTNWPPQVIVLPVDDLVLTRGLLRRRRSGTETVP